MKKIIALLLTLSVVLAFVPCVNAADSVSYKFEIVTYHDDLEYDMWADDGAFGLVIKTSGAKFSSGSVAIKYDTSLVKPGNIGRRGWEDAEAAGDCIDDTMVAGSVGTLQVGYEDLSKGYLLFNLSKVPTIDFANLTGNDDPIVTLVFAPVSEGASLESLKEAFSAIPSDDQFLADNGVATSPTKEYGGSAYFMDSTNKEYSSDKGTCTMIFPNTSAGTPVVAPSTSTPGDVSDFTDTITFPTKAEQGAETSSTYTKKIAVFAKNNTGAELAAGSYGIEIGDFYYAGLSKVPANSYWRIVLVSTDANRLTESSYSYTAVMEGATSATGTATPSSN